MGQPTLALDGAEFSEEVLPHLDAHPGTHYARLYQNYTDPRWCQVLCSRIARRFSTR
jgi:hypothetical protein